MLRYKDGENEAFECLFSRYRNLKGYTIRRIGNPQIAENIVQEAWFSVIKAKDRYMPKAKFKTYLFTILENRIIDYFRAEGRNKTHIDDDEDLELQPDTIKGTTRSVENQNFLSECIEYLKQAISKLPLEQNQCLQLKLQTDMSIAEMGDLIGVGRETVKSRLRYGIDKLKRAIPQECTQVLA